MDNTNGKGVNSLSPRNIYRAYKLEIGMFLVLLLIFIVMQVLTGNALTRRNVFNVFQAATPVIIMAMGQLLVVITGGIDLSVGSIFSLSGMVGTLVLNAYGIPAGVAAGLLTGLLCGCYNGFFVSKLRMAPFIVTLSMQGIASSLTFIVAGGNSQTITQRSFNAFDRGSFLFGIPNYLVYIVVAVIVMQLVLRKSVFGRWVYATGSNENAARLVGVPTGGVKFIAYSVSGLLCGLAALLNASYLMTVECTAGSGMEMSVIAGTVIGGASMSGGVGTAIGAFIGAMINSAIRNAINLMGINSFWDGTVTGIVIVAAVLIGTASAKQKTKR